jgi:acyl-CoA thioesterase FadM
MQSRNDEPKNQSQLFANTKLQRRSHTPPATPLPAMLPNHNMSSAVTRVVVTASYADLNCDFKVPPSVFLRWAMDARFEGFKSSPLSRVLNSPGAVMVKAQVLRMLQQSAITPGTQVAVTQSPYAVGRTSFTLKYDFHVGAVLVAEAMAVIVKVGETGATPLPTWMHEDIEWVGWGCCQLRN